MEIKQKYNAKDDPKASLKGCIVILVVAVIIGYVFNNLVCSTENKIDEKVSSMEGGIGVNRGDAIKKIQEFDSDISFKVGNDVDGFPNYYGETSGNIVQLVGNEDNLHSVYWMVFDSGDSERNQLSFMKMLAFAQTIVNKEASDWTGSRFGEIAKDFKNEYQDSVTIDGKKINISYSPNTQVTTLSVKK